ncbi:hypothetical protein [Methylobacterium goesingense]|uniref:hypothetical protein n=1 Tax=Methylobacterium goesingense TaxID=243690 RepID=UPI001EE35C33|nr:hypothetical protein [Methylobacterium goesingense]
MWSLSEKITPVALCLPREKEDPRQKPSRRRVCVRAAGCVDRSPAPTEARRGLEHPVGSDLVELVVQARNEIVKRAALHDVVEDVTSASFDRQPFGIGPTCTGTPPLPRAIDTPAALNPRRATNKLMKLPVAA